eukprot:scaffold8556_cov286-Pinguiococcus_pyrenoidosus.AAC.20
MTAQDLHVDNGSSRNTPSAPASTSPAAPEVAVSAPPAPRAAAPAPASGKSAPVRPQAETKAQQPKRSAGNPSQRQPPVSARAAQGGPVGSTGNAWQGRGSDRVRNADLSAQQAATQGDARRRPRRNRRANQENNGDTSGRAMPGMGNALVNRRVRGQVSSGPELAGEFDFEAALKSFMKIGGNATEAPAPTEKQPEIPIGSYNKDDFFDSFSSDAVNPETKIRMTAAEEREKNVDTFGAVGLYDSRRRKRYNNQNSSGTSRNANGSGGSTMGAGGRGGGPGNRNGYGRYQGGRGNRSSAGRGSSRTPGRGAGNNRGRRRGGAAGNARATGTNVRASGQKA